MTVLRAIAPSGPDAASASALRRVQCIVRRLGAFGALAVGSCGLASCGDADEVTAPIPAAVVSPAPSLGEPDEEPDEEPEAPEPEVDAERARLGTVEAGPGFMPDPTTRTGTSAEPTVDANAWDDRCSGWTARQPDVIVDAQRPFAELGVMCVSELDTTLMVVGPDGEARCGDDDDGQHPVVRGAFARGLHRVWVGVKDRDARASFVLAITELDDVTPSTLH